MPISFQLHKKSFENINNSLHRRAVISLYNIQIDEIYSSSRSKRRKMRIMSDWNERRGMPSRCKCIFFPSAFPFILLPYSRGILCHFASQRIWYSSWIFPRSESIFLSGSFEASRLCWNIIILYLTLCVLARRAPRVSQSPSLRYRPCFWRVRDKIGLSQTRADATDHAAWRTGVYKRLFCKHRSIVHALFVR